MHHNIISQFLSYSKCLYLSHCLVVYQLCGTEVPKLLPSQLSMLSKDETMQISMHFESPSFVCELLKLGQAYRKMSCKKIFLPGF